MVAAGGSVLTALKAAEILYNSKGVKCDLIDLRSISNMKLDVVLESVRKTKRLVLIEDGWKSLGYSAEIIAKVSEANINLKRIAVASVSPSALCLLLIGIPNDSHSVPKL